ncbi:MAG: Nif3-like dinuclear metal center hexameric protein [Eggerthellaceae bacterium]|nr:Nif3-like dinuclear metal center hexameric protein [Eggerthellaceae bacterium]
MAAKDMKKGKTDLAEVKVGKLSKQHQEFSVRALEKELLKKFPAEDGEDWDRNGLTVGDPSASVSAVAIALDPTVEAIREAKAAGANVLLTHHPAFITAPDSFSPGTSDLASPGCVVYTAISEGVALISLHTALDVSREASRVLPGMLGLALVGIVDPLEGDPRKGYGQLCAVKPADAPLTLGQLAARCTSVFEIPPRVWGDFEKPVTKVVTATGSASGLAKLCLPLSADCLVCGEIHYHDALAAQAAGLAVVDLGHDTSELPLVAVLVAALASIGFPAGKVAVLDQRGNWTYPESVRI